MVTTLKGSKNIQWGHKLLDGVEKWTVTGKKNETDYFLIPYKSNQNELKYINESTGYHTILRRKHTGMLSYWFSDVYLRICVGK